MRSKILFLFLVLIFADSANAELFGRRRGGGCSGGSCGGGFVSGGCSGGQCGMSYTGGGCANGQCGISGCTGDDCSEETCANGQCGVATTTNWATTNVKPLATPPPSNALYHPTIVDTTKKSFYCPNILVQGKTIYMKNPEAGYFQLWTPNADGTSPIDNKEGMVEAAWFILNHDWDNEPTNYAFLSHYWEKNFPKKTAGTAVATAAIQTGATAQRNPAVSDQHIVP